jgi:hypothetical protein
LPFIFRLNIKRVCEGRAQTTIIYHMKKIYILLATMALSAASNAQSLINKPSDRFKMSAEEVLGQRRHNGGPVNRAQSFYMDHSAANFDDQFFVWRMSSSYTATDTALNYIGLSLSHIGGFTDPADVAGTICDSSLFGFTSSYPMDIGIRIDTIYTQITHENNSGNYDKITMQIVKLTAQGAPSTTTGSSTVLWEQVDSSNVSLSQSGNWLGTGAAVVLSYTPQPTFMGASAGTKLGLVFKYDDPSKTDTLSMIAGGMKDPLDPTKTLQSTIRTSYMRYPPYIPTVSRNSNIGYGTPAGANGWFEAQNWGMWAHVTVGTDVDGFGENSANGFRMLEAYPNPSNNLTNVRYELGVQSNVTLVVTDITGRVVFQTSSENQNPGEYKVSLGTDNLSNGVYTYTLNANNASVSKRFVVSH